MKTIKLTLPEFWACAFFYGDYSGFDKWEMEGFDLWLKWAKDEGYGHCINAGTERSFIQYHDASAYVLACDCLEYTFEVVK